MTGLIAEAVGLMAVRLAVAIPSLMTFAGSVTGPFSETPGRSLAIPTQRCVPDRKQAFEAAIVDPGLVDQLKDRGLKPWV